MGFKKAVGIFCIMLFVFAIGVTASEAALKISKVTYSPTPATIGGEGTITIKGNGFTSKAKVTISGVTFKKTGKITRTTIKGTYTVKDTATIGKKSVVVKVGSKKATKKNAFEISEACTFTLIPVPNPPEFPAVGADGIITVSTEANCPWLATTEADWITLNTDSGTGTGVISFTVAENVVTEAREAAINVEDQVITIVQVPAASGECIFLLSGDPLPALFDAPGGEGVITVTTDVTCDWTATPGAPWITISLETLSGTGPGVISYAVSANTGDIRTSVITVEDKVFTIAQSALAADLIATVVSDSVTNSELSSLIWGVITPVPFPTKGNVVGGGHGALFDDLITVTLQAAHDSQNLYIKATWPDATNSATAGVLGYNGTGWVNFDPAQTNEDKLYMMFPITDSAGRAGLTFAQAGCASTCHLTKNDSGVITNTVAPLANCAMCHNNSDDVQDLAFVHPSVDPLTETCTDCHADRSFNNVVLTPLAAQTMGAGTGGVLDVWEWKAANTAPLGLARDANSAFPIATADDGGSLTISNLLPVTSTVIPQFIWTSISLGANDLIPASKLFDNDGYSIYTTSDIWLDGSLAVFSGTVGSGDYYNKDGVITITTGHIARNILFDDRGAVGGNKDLSVESAYITGTWNVLITRKLDTGNVGDVVFETGNTYNFGLAVTDNSTANHKGIALKSLLIE
ncbi:MAG: IPT/TIG domain-containing protein [Candidatus Schekmanbacteria bacterium]|nr:IPT/TIG domain-containing protein [Candidatus Schekmanbacteria bacterium]